MILTGICGSEPLAWDHLLKICLWETFARYLSMEAFDWQLRSEAFFRDLLLGSVNLGTFA